MRCHHQNNNECIFKSGFVSARSISFLDTMSLSTLNSPPLVAALGAGTLTMIPLAEKAIVDGTIPWTMVKSANALAYALSVWSTSRPGRFDSDEQESVLATEGMQKMSPGSKGKSLVTPAGWAFSIWGFIFIGELVFVGNQLFLKESSPIAPIIKKITPPFVAAQVFQSLWTASFRPKYKGVNKFISVANLSGIAYCLSLAHSAYAGNCLPETDTKTEYLLLPMTLHFGWTTAASLVNLNGVVALGDSVSATAVALLGHLSVIAATATGIFITRDRSAPVYGGVIAWALAAVASGLTTRLEETKEEDPKRVGIYGARSQRILSVLGALSNMAVSVATTKQGEEIAKKILESKQLEVFVSKLQRIFEKSLVGLNLK